MDLNFPEEILKTIRMLNEAGYQAYAVGGSVRSFLLGLPVHDYDLTTDALPEQMKQVFRNEKVYDTGIRHGTLTVIMNHIPIEITTFRTDSSYEDHRHPDSVHFSSSLKEDCQRRDFTINALCWHPQEGIIDYFGGCQDLRDHIIRCIGSPDARFQEDALRILRAVRFSAQLDFTIEPATAAAVLKNRELLKYISMERIQDELTEILDAEDCSDCIFDFLPVFQVFLPELQELHQHPEELARTRSAMKRSTAEAVTRMSLLLYQPALYSNIPAEADQILRRLKYSNSFRLSVVQILQFPDLPLFSRSDLLLVLNHLEQTAVPYLQFRCALNPDLNQEALIQQVHDLENGTGCWRLDQLAINGTDIRNMQYSGADISKALQKCLTAVMQEEVPNTKEALTQYLKDQ